jgi:hypothetical protein
MTGHHAAGGYGIGVRGGVNGSSRHTGRRRLAQTRDPLRTRIQIKPPLRTPRLSTGLAQSIGLPDGPELVNGSSTRLLANVVFRRSLTLAA